jgi:uncharacterized repeat protein (TIGR03803 family)
MPLFSNRYCAIQKWALKSFIVLVLSLNASHLYAQIPELWWMNSEGGASGLGNIASIKADGSSFTKVYDFKTSIIGSNPSNELIKTPDGRIFGTTISGGSNGSGVLFEYTQATNTYTKKIDFTGANGSSNCFLMY